MTESVVGGIDGHVSDLALAVLHRRGGRERQFVAAVQSLYYHNPCDATAPRRFGEPFQEGVMRRADEHGIGTGGIEHHLAGVQEGAVEQGLAYRLQALDAVQIAAGVQVAEALLLDLPRHLFGLAVGGDTQGFEHPRRAHPVLRRQVGVGVHDHRHAGSGGDDRRRQTEMQRVLAAVVGSTFCLALRAF